VSKENAELIADGISSGASQLGLAASIGGLASAVGTAISKSQMTPAKKAASVVLGGLAGAVFHQGATALNQSRYAIARKMREEYEKGSPNPRDFYQGPNPSEMKDNPYNSQNSSNNAINSISNIDSDSSSGTKFYTSNTNINTNINKN
jgi:hypothetical protein